MNYPDSVQFLYALGNEIKTAKFGLERIATVLDALARPQDRLHFVHVAGTNGKGSVCAMLESSLRATGRHTGLFTSPHLSEPTERIRIDGVPVSAERFAHAFDRVHAVVEELIGNGAIDMHTTYFETVTAMAMVVFEEERVDTVVLEVGLGGRLDATNVVLPDLAVITPIDFDHEAYLGRSIEAIAGEKAGILKPGVPAVFAHQRPEAAQVLAARGVDAWWTDDWPVSDLKLDARSSHFQMHGMRIDCPLAGEHQVENARTAAIALVRLGLPDAAISNGIANARWPGRLEYVAENIILDGAHNPAGARALAAYIQRFYSGRSICLIYGAMRDKAVAEITGILFPLAERVIATAPHQARALAPDTIRDISDHPNLTTTPDIDAALELARDADIVFVTGSLFLVAEARNLLVAGS